MQRKLQLEASVLPHTHTKHIVVCWSS